MTHGLRALDDRPRDLLVVGGGIYGAWIAYDAALRGLGVTLIEARDWGAGTSSASSKLIHGGLRYLEQYEFGLVRRSLRERERLLQLGPHRVRPLRLAMPVHREDRVAPWRIKLGLWLYDRLGSSRSLVGGHERLDRARFAARFPLVHADGLAAGFVFGDGQTDDARMVLEIVDGARDAGASIASRVEATRLLTDDGGRVVGVAARDALGGDTRELRATTTIDCTGPWSGLVSDGAPRPRPRLTRGTHLVLPALDAPVGFLLSSRVDRRIVFVLPWYGRTLLGTTDTDYDGDPAAVAPTDGDVEYLLARAADALRVHWTRDDVIGSFAGLRAFAAGDGDTVGGDAPSDLSREWVLDRSRPGLLASIGGKYTSARADAERAVDAVYAAAGRAAAPATTGERPFPWAPPREPAWREATLRRAASVGFDEPTAATLIDRHGIRASLVLDAAERDRRGARRIVEEVPFCVAEIAHAVDHELAADLDDILRRRVPLELLARPASIPYDALARLAGERLGWSPAEATDRADAARRRATERSR